MEKLEKILKLLLLFVSIILLSTIEYQFLGDGINVNLSGSVQVFGDMKVDGYISNDVDFKGFPSFDVELSGGINTYEQN